MKILVLAGGESSEREVSARSGIAVARALIYSGNEVALIDPATAPLTGKPSFSSDSDSVIQYFKNQRKGSFTPPFNTAHIDVIRSADTVFPALHGGIGENGHLASLLDILGVPYVGSNARALAVTMNKVDTKIYYENASILTPSYTVYKKEMKKTPCPPRYPCVVKPASAGSSIGVYFVFGENELFGALENALKESDTVIIEERIYGRELSVSVLENKALAVTEIIPKGAYYDYDSKYLNGGAREITPAPIPFSIAQRALKIAENAHNALGLSGFSRTDLIMQRGTGRLYALETNALPGMTETSILPTAARSVGIEMSELACRMLRK